SEAEWEYACRAGGDTAWSCGGAEDVLGKYAWFEGNSLSRSGPVGTLKPNDVGLFDLHGNVWEWCQEAAEREGQEAIREDISRVLRGGSCGDQASDVRSASRDGGLPADRFDHVGFRVARTSP